MPNAYQKQRERQFKERQRLAKNKPKPVKKMSKRDFNRTWGLHPDYKLRWVGLAGVAWYYLSIVRRKEDAKKYGKCVSCPSELQWHEGDGGHYISVSRSQGMKLREDNVYLQCKRCNNPKWSPDASIPFGVEIDRRHYKGKAAELYAQSKCFTNSMSELELLSFIGDLRARADAL